MSPVSKSQQKAVHKYVREKYDRINITVPKGRKEVLQTHAESVGQSLNAFVVQAVDERVERETNISGDAHHPD